MPIFHGTVAPSSVEAINSPLFARECAHAEEKKEAKRLDDGGKFTHRLCIYWPFAATMPSE